MIRQNFNDDWIFSKKDSGIYHEIELPHDAMIMEERSENSPGGSASGWFHGGNYEYKKVFDVPDEWKEKHVELLFEGVYKDSVIMINGNRIMEHAYGYTPFSVNLDGLLKKGEENEIKILVHNLDLPNSRWYTGAGIYRPVWLCVAEKEYIPLNGVKIKTISYEEKRVYIKTSHLGGEVELEIWDNNQVIVIGKGDDICLNIPEGKLWSENNPYLYKCHVILKKEGTILDEAWEEFGIRSVSWNEQGLFVNGEKTLLKGACVHSDNGILGARSYEKSEDRRIKKLKEYGFNAIRVSHNLAAESMIKACDKYGIYVMDETWDVWYNHKSPFDYAKDFNKNYKKDIKDMVERDYNHPSVIMYSIGNEISEPVEEKGVELLREMQEYLKSLDDGRAVTAGINLMIIHKAKQGNAIYDNEQGGRKEEKKPAQEMNSTMFNIMTSQVGAGMVHAADSDEADEATTPCLDVLDIAGYNYASGRYPLEGEKHPKRIIIGTETFPHQLFDNWSMVEKYPYLIGDFMWTGWDYLGEAGIGAWAYTKDGMAFDKPYPWVLADVGAFDILGNAGAQAAYASIIWGEKKAYIGVRPVNHPGKEPAKGVWRGTNAFDSWSWSGCEGNTAIVEVYGVGSSAEIFLNGESQGKKELDKYKAEFEVIYKAGEIRADIYNENDEKIATTKMCSASEVVSLNIIPEEKIVNQGEIIYVNITLADEEGIIESNADCNIQVSVEGGDLLAFGSANPRTEEGYNEGAFTTYYGKAQAIIKATSVKNVVVKASGEKYGTVKKEIQVNS